MKRIILVSTILILFAVPAYAQVLYTGSDGGRIYEWDVTTGSPVNNFSSPYVDAMAFGDDGYLYTGDNFGNRIYAWDVTTGQIVNQFNSGYVSAMAFGDDGYLYTGDDFGSRIDVWDVTTGARVNNFSSPYVSAMAFQPTVVPEPISSILFLTGGGVLAGRRYFRRRK